MGALEELYASGEAWQDCLRILKLRAEAAQDQYEKIAGWFRVAEIASERLSDAAELQGALKSVLVVDQRQTSMQLTSWSRATQVAKCGKKSRAAAAQA